MNSSYPIKSGVLTNFVGQRRNSSKFFPIISALLFFILLAFVLPHSSPAQDRPEWPVRAHGLGNSPVAGQHDAEGPITITGKLTVLYGDDFANKRGKFFYFLKNQETSETFELHFGEKAPKHLRSGSIVKARGKAKGRELFLALDETGQAGVETVLPAEAVVAGEQRVIVLVADFLDVPVDCSVDEIQELMFSDPFESSVDDMYQETSSGHIWFDGNVTGPFTIDYTSTGSCDFSSWAAAVEAAAQAQGLDLSTYQRKVYVLPRENPCGWAGLGTVGGHPSRAWIFRCDADDVFAHELGHNLGMHHASTPTSEYGDTSDIMGYSGYGLRQINAPHQEQMAWRPSGQIITVTESGLYEIAPLEFISDQTIIPQILKIAKPDTGEYYYLSYRKPIGFDNNLPASYRDRLNIHAYKGDGSAGKTFFLDALADSESFVDTINGIRITQASHTNEMVTVQIQLEAACTPAAPLVSISPADQSAVPGAALNYNVAVTNNDGPSCTQSAFALNPSVPTGWSGTLVPVTLTLLPGETGQATLTVTSPVNSEAKTYLLNLDVSNTAEPLHTGSGHARYVVESINESDTEAPTIPGGLKAGLKGKNVKLAWNAATDDVGVSGYAVWRNGARIGDTTDTGYVDSAVPSGVTCTYTVSAYDAAGNTSASSSAVTVTTRSGSKGGGKGKPK